MESSERKSQKPKLSIVETPVLGAAPAKPVSRLTLQQRQELDRLYRQCPRPSAAFLQHVGKDIPALANLDIHFLKTWFRSRRYKEKIDEKLSPLISKNAALRAEHQSLLLLNNRLRSQARLLNFENQRLKEELGKQLEWKHGAEVVEEGYSSDACESDAEPNESAMRGLESNLHEVKLHE